MASAAFEAIVDDFDFLEEWEDRYRYVIEMGKKAPGLDENQKIPETRVLGCASQVWIVPEITDNSIDFKGDSDAMIVKGLIAVVHALFAGNTAAQILEIDAMAELGRLGLDQHLSSQRSNGLRAMIKRIRQIAEALEEDLTG